MPHTITTSAASPSACTQPRPARNSPPLTTRVAYAIAATAVSAPPASATRGSHAEPERSTQASPATSGTSRSGRIQAISAPEPGEARGVAVAECVVQPLDEEPQHRHAGEEIEQHADLHHERHAVGERDRGEEDRSEEHTSELPVTFLYLVCRI